MEIKVLGSGCPNCKKLYGTVETAVKELGIQAEVKYLTDPKDIAKAKIMSTPAVIIDSKIVSQGRVLSIKEAKDLISKTK